MSKRSAGILLYRYRNSELEIFLVHPGGPFWSKKDLGVWSIPKGEFSDDEDPLEAAKREFQEETGKEITGEPLALTPVQLKSGKKIYAFALEQDLDEKQIHSNNFQLEWPPKSGHKMEFPEIDRAEWFDVKKAKEKLIASMGALVDELLRRLTK